MSIFEAIILGAVQGLTEFLPVSSSGHLVLLQKIFRISEPVLLFDTMVHVGTLLAVFVVLRQDIWSILRRPFQPLTFYLILATIPAVVAALFFKEQIEKAFSTASFLGFAFLITSALLIISEFLSRRRSGWLKNQESMNRLDALIIGILQAVAIIPGVSRSGSTLSGALSRKLDRNFAARFSFLLSIPAILGALVLQINDIASGQAPESLPFLLIIAGTITAALVGFFAINLMLRIIQGSSLRGFALYTAILGILVLVDQFVTHLFF
ncbi:MAG: undecaprenyl-diphosphate phosphatase [Treponema sp.]|jgi:undecaprenyl-diphosphatase|nr:undecaprenyl-diphosphate phosphatase [Treponema sp.]